MFKLGLIINPIAGIGGPAGLKGSDGEQIQQLALTRGSGSQAAVRTRLMLDRLLAYRQQIIIHTYPGIMGAEVAQECGFKTVVYGHIDQVTRANDTQQAAKTLHQQDVDLLVFAGGDGTARDIFSALSAVKQAVLGLPAGVKIHSSVYAVKPEAVADIVIQLLNHELLTLQCAQVRDIDEEAFRRNQVTTRFYGELWVPSDTSLIQQIKSSPTDQTPLEQADIAAYIIEQMQPDWRYILGPGSTTKAITEELGIIGTLLGVDVLENQQLLASDVSEQQLFGLIRPQKTALIITATGNQGHVLGRGNQQLSPRIIREIGAQHIMIIATSAKLNALSGRPLWVDTGDTSLNQSLAGYWPVITGYETEVLYCVA